MSLRVEVTSDPEEYHRIRQAVKDNGGYCPCALHKKPETKCMCKAFREQSEPGPCHCGLYVKVEGGNENG